MAQPHPTAHLVDLQLYVSRARRRSRPIRRPAPQSIRPGEPLLR